MNRRQLLLSFSLLIMLTCPPAMIYAYDAGDLLVTVNGKRITEGDLQFFMLARSIPENRQQELRKQSLNILVERAVMASFLEQRKVKVTQPQLDAATGRIITKIKKQGKDPQQQLAKFGFDEKKLKRELALPLAWRGYVRTLITDDQLRSYFKQHSDQYNGTQVQAAHIFIKLTKDAAAEKVSTATKRLTSLRQKIVDGELTFAEAARTHSESPSKQQGGNVGLIAYRGNMPATFSQAAFRLKVGEVSEPVRTPFGLHLITITKRQPGEISLEDVRAIVFNDLAKEIWNRLVKQQREKATIKWEKGITN